MREQSNRSTGAEGRLQLQRMNEKQDPGKGRIASPELDLIEVRKEDESRP